MIPFFTSQFVVARAYTRSTSPFYRSQDSISAYSFLENRFGPWARIYASSCYLLTQIARTGSIL
ncbi:hypothetical protein, partial [Phocaeicola sp.]|uniref:hypothetical protein n=1 Tax=Phocaeicola sp. TaxID=2773926 RepID=UPI003AB41EC3